MYLYITITFSYDSNIVFNFIVKEIINLYTCLVMRQNREGC